MAQSKQTQPRTSWTEQDRKDALKVYQLNHTRHLSDTDPQILKLANEQGRNPASVSIKLQNFRFLDPRAEGASLTGMAEFSKQDVVCWLEHSKLPLSKRAIAKIHKKEWKDLLETKRMIGTKIPQSTLSNSLLTKPFLILTGPSGTGKTLGAIELAKTVCGKGCHQLVAVGADWTDNRHVLGYLNPLETEAGDENRAIYETTAILDLILHADDHPDDAHVLILDEMNLSHVERYFADFLSAMELKDKTDALKLHAAGTAVTRTGREVEGQIDFPSNLFVIGTVNIDETTYMFSPKVLDRANVIEIHADPITLEHLLKQTPDERPQVQARDYGVSFLDAARAVRVEDYDLVPQLPPEVRKAAANHLMSLFRIMKRGRGEFGFRTGKEVMDYLRTAQFLSGPHEAGMLAWEASGERNEGWMESLDEQILQKILPKLHGSRSRLAPLLGALATYCATGEEKYALEHFPEDGAIPKRGLKDAGGAAPLKFPESYKKLERMIAVLVEEQFVSFIC